MTQVSKVLQKVHVALPEGKAYDIVIGKHLLNNPDYFKTWVKDREVMIISNPTVANFYLEIVVNSVKEHSARVETCLVIDSEEGKSATYLEQIYEKLLAANFSRRCLIIALGGGVIGDLAGYAAATYQRGVDFLQIPTTLLAQVDSSIGGKTAINHKLGKNMIGAFHQPKHVLIDIEVLKTLEWRQFRAGMAEVIKYGLIFSRDFLIYLENNATAIEKLAEEELAYIIGQSCKFKAQVVIADEKEQGQRALLNLGHTFGHAIEAHMGYGSWLHGEAIASGMMLAGAASLLLTEQYNPQVLKSPYQLAEELLSDQEPLLTEEEKAAKDICFTIGNYKRMKHLFKYFDLPTHLPEQMTNDNFLFYMARDKKNLTNQIVLVLFQELGQAYVEKKAKKELILKSLDFVRNYH